MTVFRTGRAGSRVALRCGGVLVISYRAYLYFVPPVAAFSSCIVLNWQVLNRVLDVCWFSVLLFAAGLVVVLTRTNGYRRYGMARFGTRILRSRFLRATVGFSLNGVTVDGDLSDRGVSVADGNGGTFPSGPLFADEDQDDGAGDSGFLGPNHGGQNKYSGQNK